MKNLFETLNLSPQERRLVVGVLVVVFVLVNFWLVWPHFNDWQGIQQQREEARQKLGRYETEAKLKSALQGEITKLEDTGTGIQVASGDPSLYLDRAVRKIARESGVSLGNVNSRASLIGSKTNDFFEERVITINLEGNDQQLVAFLHSLGSSNSLIRVRDMNLRPNQTQTSLMGDLTLVASFQRDESAPPSTPKAK